MIEKKHYSEKDGHFGRGLAKRARQTVEKYLPELHFRALTNPNAQSLWVTQTRIPTYGRRDGRR